MTIQFANANDGVECDFFANFTEGSSNSQGTGSFDQAWSQHARHFHRDVGMHEPR